MRSGFAQFLLAAGRQVSLSPSVLVQLLQYNALPSASFCHVPSASPGLLQSQCWLPNSLLIPGKTWKLSSVELELARNVLLGSVFSCLVQQQELLPGWARGSMGRQGTGENQVQRYFFTINYIPGIVAPSAVGEGIVSGIMGTAQFSKLGGFALYFQD